MNLVTIYELVDPRNGTCRYVGKTSRSLAHRLNCHISSSKSRKTHKDNWVKQLLELGMRPVIRKLDSVPALEWPFWEREYIRLFRAIAIPLTNVSDGGELPPPITEETRNKIRLANTGRRPWNLGRSHPPETREKIRLALLGNVPSEEACAKISAANRGRKLSEEHKKKIGAWQVGRKLTPEHCRNMGNAKRGTKHSLETRQKISQSLLGNRRGKKN